MFKVIEKSFTASLNLGYPIIKLFASRGSNIEFAWISVNKRNRQKATILIAVIW